MNEMNNNLIFAIDPGPSESAYVIWDGKNQKILEKAIVSNKRILQLIYAKKNGNNFSLIMEMVEYMGMPVGREVFETVLWIGRFVEAAGLENMQNHLMGRRKVKIYFCNSMKAKDSNVRQSLINRFGPPGTKHKSGLTYGLKKDLWSAFALAVTYYDLFVLKQPQSW